MTIQHTVVFRLVHPAGTAEEVEFLETAAATLTAIDGVTDFVINQQISPKSDLTWQFSMVFADQDRYDAYNDHPAHVEFVRTRWQTEVAAFQEYDFTAREA
ncbi:MAG TPA: Dabb family protein [Microlunatus sp.]|nr:Dabb family protein [Microlunatus sp.]